MAPALLPTPTPASAGVVLPVCCSGCDRMASPGASTCCTRCVEGWHNSACAMRQNPARVSAGLRPLSAFGFFLPDVTPRRSPVPPCDRDRWGDEVDGDDFTPPELD